MCQVSCFYPLCHKNFLKRLDYIDLSHDYLNEKKFPMMKVGVAFYPQGVALMQKPMLALDSESWKTPILTPHTTI